MASPPLVVGVGHTGRDHEPSDVALGERKLRLP